MNFTNFKNRQNLRKFRGIDLYAIPKPSAKFKRNWFTSFEIIPLLNFDCLACIFMENTQYEKMLLNIQCIGNIPIPIPIGNILIPIPI